MPESEPSEDTPVSVLTIAISSSALFDLNESNRVYEEEGLEAYRRYQIAHEDKVLERGEAFNFVDKFLNINKLLNKHRGEGILWSRNSADTGLRIFNSIAAPGQRTPYTAPANVHDLNSAFMQDKFLNNSQPRKNPESILLKTFAFIK